jgi:hypothetical protein
MIILEMRVVGVNVMSFESSSSSGAYVVNSHDVTTPFSSALSSAPKQKRKKSIMGGT